MLLTISVKLVQYVTRKYGHQTGHETTRDKKKMAKLKKPELKSQENKAPRLDSVSHLGVCRLAETQSGNYCGEPYLPV